MRRNGDWRTEDFVALGVFATIFGIGFLMIVVGGA
jgi:hypothetical protein